MAYEKRTSDRPLEPGRCLDEAKQRLLARPEQIPALEQFVDYWGLDGYDPFDADGCSNNVRAIVHCLLEDVKAAMNNPKNTP